MSEASPAPAEGDVPPQQAAGEAAPLKGPARHPVRRTFDVLLLLVVSLLILAPGVFTLPVTDRDEARFVQATKQMIETGDWIDIRFQEETRYKKPVGIYWLQGAAVLASGQGADAPIWVYRLPSLFGTVAAVLLVYVTGVALAGPAAGSGAALAAALLAASTVLISIEARIAKTDGMLLASVMAAMWALASAWMDGERARRFGRNAVFWTALGVGVLIKGPVILMVAVSALAVLSVSERSLSLLKSLSPLKGGLWLLALVLPWLVAIGLISDGAFFVDSIGRDMLGKVATGQESHGAPPGMHALAAFGTFWPLAAFVPAAVVWAFRNGSTPAVRFLAAWIVPSWVVFEVVATKLPNYVLPLMPAFALMAGLALMDGALDPRRGWRRAMASYVAVGAILLAFGLNGAFVYIEERASIPGIAAAIVASVAGIAAWRLLIGGRMKAGIAVTVLAAGLTTTTGFGLLLPSADRLWLSDRMADAVDAIDLGCPSPVMISVGYQEPSAVFLLGTGTRLYPPDGGARAFAEAACGVAFVEAGQAGAFLAALQEAGASAAPDGQVEAYNFNGLKLRTMQIYAKR